MSTTQRKRKMPEINVFPFCPVPHAAASLPKPQDEHKRFFIRDFVVFFDMGLSVFFDLNLPCRHDFTTPVSTVRRKASLLSKSYEGHCGGIKVHFSTLELKSIKFYSKCHQHQLGPELMRMSESWHAHEMWMKEYISNYVLSLSVPVCQ